jgi:hypothetical protein
MHTDLDETDPTMARALAAMIDGNAAAGLLLDLFGVEMTAIPSKCAHCGNVAAIGTMLAWMDGPGVVLRCSICHEVVLRVAETPAGRFVDARGAAYISMPAARA